ncbi:hypothetical protein [Roseibium sp. M-1]
MPSDASTLVREGAELMDLSVQDDKSFNVVHGYSLPNLKRDDFTLAPPHAARTTNQSQFQTSAVEIR